MVWISWVLALIAFAAVGYLAMRWNDERKTTQQLRNERMHLADEIEQLKIQQARLIQRVPLARMGRVASDVAREVDPPLGFARSNVEGIGELLDDYRKLVKNYDAAVQYCLQPVEMIFGADKAGLDQLVKHVEEARRRLFSARGELEKSSILSDSKELLGEAVVGLGRSSTLMQSLCRISRPDAEGLDTIDINEMIDAALNLLMPEWGERIVVVREFADLPKITAMLAQIGRVIVNILDNCAAAIEGGGRIGVQTRAAGTRTIEVRFSDSGPGIASEILPEVFEPFFTTRDDALGLGLGIAHGIVKSHGGSITIRSTSAEGTVVVMSLPITAAAQAGVLPAHLRR